MDKRPPSYAQLRGRHGPMKILSAEKTVIHSLHQSVQHIAGSMGVWIIIGRAIISDILFQFLNRPQNYIWNLALFAPFDQSSDALRECGFIFSMIAFPKLGGDLIKNLFILSLGPVPNLNKNVEKTAKDNHRGKKDQPCISSGFPTINIYRRGLV